MTLNRKFLFALAAAVGLAANAGAVQAQDTLPPATASVNDLGDGASALTYWVDRSDGRLVVTTVDLVVRDGSGNGEDHHAIVRFSALLSPGQSQTVSVPASDGAQPQELQIQRIGDRIAVTRVSATPVAANSARVH